MSNRQRFVFLTATGSRPSIWLKIGVSVAVIAAGFILLSLGLVLVLAVAAAAILMLLPAGIRRWFAAARRPQGPATVEGEYTIASPDASDARDESPGQQSAGDPERPDGPFR